MRSSSGTDNVSALFKICLLLFLPTKVNRSKDKLDEGKSHENKCSKTGNAQTVKVSGLVCYF